MRSREGVECGSKGRCFSSIFTSKEVSVVCRSLPQECVLGRWGEQPISSLFSASLSLFLSPASVPWPPCQAIERDGRWRQEGMESLPLSPGTSSSQMTCSQGSQEAQEPWPAETRPLPQSSSLLWKNTDRETLCLQTLWTRISQEGTLGDDGIIKTRRQLDVNLEPPGKGDPQLKSCSDQACL